MLFWLQVTALIDAHANTDMAAHLQTENLSGLHSDLRQISADPLYQVNFPLIWQLVVLLSRTAAVRVPAAVLSRQRWRAAVRTRRQVGQLRLVVRVAARVASFMAAVAVGRSFCVAWMFQQALKGGGLVWRNAQFFLVGQHRSASLIGDNAVSLIC